MDVNVVYHVDNRNDIYKYLKPWIRPNSIQLAYINMQFDDVYYMRKILYNLQNLLDNNYYIVIECGPESFTPLYQFCKSTFETFVYWGAGLSLYLFITKRFIPIAWHENTIDLSFFLKLTKTQDNILLISSLPKDSIAIIRNLARNVIVFTDYEYNIYEGVANWTLPEGR